MDHTFYLFKIIDDNTLPTFVHEFLGQILAELEQAGADFSRILLMSALGIHSLITQAEMEEKVGTQNLARIQWRNHDAFASDEMAAFGTMSWGTPVVLNKAVAEVGATFLLAGG